MTLMKTEPRRSSAFQDGDRKMIADAFRAVRRATVGLQEPVGPEDCCIQSMPDVSPMKWHLAHTSWFFESFVLQPSTPDYRSPDPQFEFLSTPTTTRWASNTRGRIGASCRGPPSPR